MAADVTSARDHLVAALEADLVGPFEPPGPDGVDACDEVLPLPPSRWYLTGFLAPMDARVPDDPPDDAVAAGSDIDTEDGNDADAGPKRKHVLPASIGLSVLLPPPPGSEDGVEVTLRWATYMAESRDGERGTPAGRTSDATTVTVWRRQPQPARTMHLALDAGQLARGIEVAGAPGVWLQGRLTDVAAPSLRTGTRALSLFLVNRQGKGDRGRADERFLFQAEMTLTCGYGFAARPNARGGRAHDGDDQVADLQFRSCQEWAVGHGVATVAAEADDGVVRRVATRWVPRAEVRPVKARQIAGVDTRMEALGRLDDASAVGAALGPLPEAYAAWLDQQEATELGGVARRATRDRLLSDARRARDRIREGIALVAAGGEAADAFRLMNQVMARQSRVGRPGETPRWRLFQLAFVLLSLPSMADEGHPDREQVELIYFPTGGGKTEAYLGVIGFALILRRLRGQIRSDGGYGVAVLLRYTLRLLTLDQLGRAATLVCALELLRRTMPDRLGSARFAVGLWVGKSATANTLADVTGQVTRFKASRGNNAASPFPLTQCPWCRAAISRDGMRLWPDSRKPTEVRVTCANDDCAFHVDGSPEGLPVLFVDEQIYRELPAFLVATVDKLAMLPWRGETGMLFGRAQHRDGRAFFGPLDHAPAHAVPLPDGLRPPELIVQDELHLISGPLGTMVGLYESVIEKLCQRRGAPGQSAARKILAPKILAATATVRQATQQIRALFGRTAPPAVFPPPGIDDGETFFAELDHKKPSRLYVGVAASGRPMKLLLLRTYIALLSAAGHQWSAREGDETADAYMTLVGYFNSLRELGGMRRLVEDEVAWRCQHQRARHPEGVDAGRWFADRTIVPEPVELTSRESTARIVDSKARLEASFARAGTRRPSATPHPVDVALASNMISVGVDVGRLGLMVVAGQPKTTAEYIQATSRVGREAGARPGLVVTCFNTYRARDRSHYEHFVAYHEAFYRDVEASSLTPFSAPALGRGLAGALVAMVRHLDPVLTPNAAAALLPDHRAVGDAAVAALVDRARRHRSLDEAETNQRARDLEAMGIALLDRWERLVRHARADAGGRRYSPYDRDRGGGAPLLHTVLDDDAAQRGEDDRRFAAPTSMRDVEPTVHLWLERQPLGGRGV